jgi:hypothetical protein
MKCNVCHNEFGNGEYCQNCEVDKVVGLGSYTGYDVPTPNEIGSTEPTRSTISNSDLIICYHCTSAIPSDAEFCPACGIMLYTTCPQCGNRFSSQYNFCSRCGKNINEYIAEQRRKKELEIAKQKEQEELRRIEELKRQKQLRLIAIAEQQPEYKEAFSYLSEMYNKCNKKHELSSFLATATIIILSSIGVGICLLFLSLDRYGAFMLFISLTPVIVIVIEGFGWRGKIKRLIVDKIWNTKEYINITYPIQNTTTRNIVLYVCEMGSDRKKSISLEKQVLEAYLKVTQEKQ